MKKTNFEKVQLFSKAAVEAKGGELSKLPQVMTKEKTEFIAKMVIDEMMELLSTTHTLKERVEFFTGLPVDLNYRQDLTPKEIEGHINILYRIINHAARSEAFEQFQQDLREDRDENAMSKLGVPKSNREVAQSIRTKLNNPQLKPDQPVIGSVIAPTEGSQTIPVGA